MSGEKPREIALQILERRSDGQFVEDLLTRSLASTNLTPVDRHLCQELVYGIVRWQATLDWLIARKSRRPPVSSPGGATPASPGPPSATRLQNLLRLGLYQIFWLERIPNHAAVNETVELARRAGLSSRTGFVNAVLRGYLREFDATRAALTDLKKTEPHLGYSHPDWLATRWLKRWGHANTIRLMDWNNAPPKSFARVNTLKTDASRLQALWRNENVQFEPVHHDWLAETQVFELKSHPRLADLPSFQSGCFYIQDPSTLLAVAELSPQPRETVLDLCAAPGGKLTHIAQLMRKQGRLVAHDTSRERLNLISENCARLGVTWAETVLPSAFSSPPAFLFDRVLLDAPCSNTGVMRRRVDLRWRVRPEEIRRLRLKQLHLLRQAAGLLRPGGTLVYSTCSLEPEENGEVVTEFLAEHPNLRLELQRELLPFANCVDGAYVARIKKD